mmetsp:Transcript_12243/g.49159  ORF Transcript_12243/g.49159 Transcript_12243/m.49159 type:complete len:205 (+) Transcript_12243:169-783(+)
MHLLVEDGVCKGVHNVALDCPLEGPSAVDLVVALVGEPSSGLWGDNERDLLVSEELPDVLELDANDAVHVLAAQPVEHEDLVQAVDELWWEVLLDTLHHCPARARCGCSLRKARQNVCSEVARENDHRVPKVHLAALAVGEVALVEHLQKQVGDLAVGLFELVKQHNAVGAAAHGLRQGTALLVAHVPGRRADEPAHGELLHVL